MYFLHTHIYFLFMIIIKIIIIAHKKSIVREWEIRHW